MCLLNFASYSSGSWFLFFLNHTVGYPLVLWFKPIRKIAVFLNKRHICKIYLQFYAILSDLECEERTDVMVKTEKTSLFVAFHTAHHSTILGWIIWISSFYRNWLPDLFHRIHKPDIPFLASQAEFLYIFFLRSPSDHSYKEKSMSV